MRGAVIHASGDVLPQGASGMKRVLLVEDNPAVAGVAEQALLELGCRVAIARDYATARALTPTVCSM